MFLLKPLLTFVCLLFNRSFGESVKDDRLFCRGQGRQPVRGEMKGLKGLEGLERLELKESHRCFVEERSISKITGEKKGRLRSERSGAVWH